MKMAMLKMRGRGARMKMASYQRIAALSRLELPSGLALPSNIGVGGPRSFENSSQPAATFICHMVPTAERLYMAALAKERNAENAAKPLIQLSIGSDPGPCERKKLSVYASHPTAKPPTKADYGQISETMIREGKGFCSWCAHIRGFP